jgi:hypothetical protein
MNVDDDKLMAFADGELSDAERAEIERALAEDHALREKLAAHRRLRARLSAAFDDALDEPVPARLRDAALGRTRSAQIVRLAERGAAKWSAREWGAMAASLAAGLVLGVGVMNARAPLIASTDDGLVARGALARALETQLAADAEGAVRIGLSFRARDGGYCRTFALTAGATSGLACRDDAGWTVAMAVEEPTGGEVRMAGASERLLAAVEAMIDGAPLDAAAEARARDRGWREDISDR